MLIADRSPKQASIVIWAALVALLVLPHGAAVAPVAAPAYWQGFEADDSGWFPHPTYGGAVVRVASGSGMGEDYAPGVASAAGEHHARLALGNFLGGFGNIGPSTRWGGTVNGEQNPNWPADGYVTQVRIYVDTAYAAAHPDKRFDFLSSINRPDGTHLRDFSFNAGTSTSGDGTLAVSASNNAFRSSAWPENPGRSPVWIGTDGWYTFRHTFSDNGGALSVVLQILDDDGDQVASWQLGGDPIANVGGPRSGWFANNEISGLPIDETVRVNGGATGLLADLL